MNESKKIVLALTACAMFSALFVLTPQTKALAGPEISVWVDHVTVDPGEQEFIIPVYISNFTDTLAGFEIWFQLDRPDLIQFRIELDSVIDSLYWNCNSGTWPACADSTLVTDTSLGYDFASEFINVYTDKAYDTVGTLASGWEFVASNSLGGQGFDIKVVGIADLFTLPITPGVGSQTGGVLFNLIAKSLPVSDSIVDRTVNIHISEQVDNTSFSDPQGGAIGLEFDTLIDTTYWLCQQYNPEQTVCLTWSQVPTPPFDSLTIDTIQVPRLELGGGFVTLARMGCCLVPGDVNHSGAVTISDVTYGIGRIFSGFAPPVCNDEADANSDGILSIGDITYLIQRIFAGGPAPICGTTGN